MIAQTAEGVSNQSREIYLRSLFIDAKNGKPEAFTELGQIAQGRTDLPLAKELFGQLDGKMEVKING